jgi:uncharacterized phage protein (TIGR02220 family)
MKESKVKDENYINIQGWMVTKLGLKGNELLIYAIIYGFSQTEDQTFNGSLQYLADWTNSTKQGVTKNLKALVEKGYIIKEDKYINNVKFCEYYATKFNTVYNSVAQGMQQSLTGYTTKFNTPMQQSLTNNINDNIDNKLDNIIELKDNVPYQEIVNYLNNSAGTNYRASSKKTRELIKARINEGYTLEDFRVVIEKKTRDWINDNKMKGYLRPETLFGSKFEGYLNQPVKELTTKDLTPYTDFSEFYTD